MIKPLLAKAFVKPALLISLLLLVFSCKQEAISLKNDTRSDSLTRQGNKTKNVIIVVVDGARYSETWGDTTHQYIPKLYSMRSQGVMLTHFYNQGYTYTDPGHDAICTGFYENLENSGQDLPQYPSIFQAWLKSSAQSPNKAWVIASKDKLRVLANCKQQGWTNLYQPRTDCGPGYRSDDTTYVRVKRVLKTYHPNLMLVNFKDPDTYGHSNMWNNYVASIKTTDSYIADIWNQIQADTAYRDKTMLIVTNDHGRHLNGVADWFINHGDDCQGCRHIEFFAIGPNVKRGLTIATQYEQTDISQTVAKLLNFNMEYSKGRVMYDILR